MLPKHVFFVVGTLGMGGAEKQLFYQVSELRRQGVKVSAAVLKKSEFWEGRMKSAGCQIIHVKSKGRFGRLFEIASSVKKKSPCIVQSSHFYTNLYAWFAGSYTGIPSIGAVRTNVYCEVGSHPWPLGRLSLVAPTWIFANSEEAVQNCILLGRRGDRIRLLENAIDTDEYSPSAQRGRCDLLRILWVGRMVDSKRPVMFVRLTKRLVEDGHRVRAIMLGDGPLRRETAAFVKESGVEGVVEIVGAVEDTRPFLRESDLFVLTSEHEGMPNVVLEAMACGVPIATSPVGGVKRLLGEFSSLCIAEDFGEQALYEVVKRLLEEEDRREALGVALRERAVGLFGLRQLGQRLEALYGEVLERAESG